MREDKRLTAHFKRFAKRWGFYEDDIHFAVSYVFSPAAKRLCGAGEF
jgi:hypothetical protein